jgi:hypothetical protein
VFAVEVLDLKSSFTSSIPHYDAPPHRSRSHPKLQIPCVHKPAVRQVHKTSSDVVYVIVVVHRQQRVPMDKSTHMYTYSTAHDTTCQSYVDMLAHHWTTKAGESLALKMVASIVLIRQTSYLNAFQHFSMRVNARQVRQTRSMPPQLLGVGQTGYKRCRGCSTTGRNTSQDSCSKS